MFIVELKVDGESLYLIGFSWIRNKKRAQRFETKSAASFILYRARKFMDPDFFRRAHIVEETMEDNFYANGGIG